VLHRADSRHPPRLELVPPIPVPVPHLAVPVPEPRDLRSDNGVLKVEMSIHAVLQENGAAHYCYLLSDGSIAPTLRLHPGDLLILTLKNDLLDLDASVKSLLVSPSHSRVLQQAGLRRRLGRHDHRGTGARESRSRGPAREGTGHPGSGVGQSQLVAVQLRAGGAPDAHRARRRFGQQRLWLRQARS